jgi:shikimate dehydrogenase
VTWRLGVIGTPVAHSLTPAMHDAVLNALGLSGTSRAFDVGRDDEEGLAGALSSIDAVSVTMPLKSVLVDRCDQIDDVAARVGAVNSLWRHDGGLHGRSTDGLGFLDALLADFNEVVTGRTVVVLGSGGAARSIVDACSVNGAERVIVRARNGSTANDLATRYDRVIANPPAVADVDLVVNAIVGGAPHDLPPCAVEFVPNAVAIDIAYRPDRSAWLEEHARDGWRTANGLSMLAHQARHQMAWWFGCSIPLAPLLAAVGR